MSLCSHLPLAFAHWTMLIIPVFLRNLFSFDFDDAIIPLLLSNFPSQTCLQAHLFLPCLKMLIILEVWHQHSLSSPPSLGDHITPLRSLSLISTWLSFPALKSFLSYRFLRKPPTHSLGCPLETSNSKYPNWNHLPSSQSAFPILHIWLNGTKIQQRRRSHPWVSPFNGLGLWSPMFFRRRHLHHQWSCQRRPPGIPFNICAQTHRTPVLLEGHLTMICPGHPTLPLCPHLLPLSTSLPLCQKY